MNAPAPATDTDLFDEATRWCLRRREARDPNSESEYQTWLSGGPGRLEAMQEAEALLDLLHEPAIAVARDTDRARSVRPRHLRPWQGWAVAASLLVAALGAYWYMGDGQYRLRGDEVTAVGETRTLSLADGSRITLDTGSAVKVIALGSERRVRLDRGQAFFQVAKDPDRPFIVETPAGNARVLGTAFDVRRYDDRSRVSVVEGAVEVTAHGHADKTILRPGHGAWLTANGTRPLAVQVTDEVAVWRQGQLIFYRTPLRDVATELDRYYPGRLLVQGQAAQNTLISGVFNTSDVKGAVQGIAASSNLRILHVGTSAIFIY